MGFHSFSKERLEGGVGTVGTHWLPPERSQSSSARAREMRPRREVKSNEMLVTQMLGIREFRVSFYSLDATESEAIERAAGPAL